MGDSLATRTGTHDRRNGRRRRQSQAENGRGISARVDLGGLDQLAGYLICRAQVGVLQELKRLFGPFGITPMQFSVLKVIQANPGISQARVAEVLYIETSRMVQKVDRLEVRQLVERRRSDSDRRAHELHLTPAGGDLLAELMPLVEAHERVMAERIGQKAMADIVESLRAIVT